MEKTENNLPGLNNHNSFAKIIKNLFDDNFIFSECWYERINEDTWEEVSSCRFKNIVFERNGAFEKYLRKYIEKSINYDEFKELDKVILVYNSIFVNESSSKQGSH